MSLQVLLSFATTPGLIDDVSSALGRTRFLKDCGGGDGHGKHSLQRFNYKAFGNSGRIAYAHPQDNQAVVSVDMGWCDETHPCDMILWFKESDSDNKGENLVWNPATKQIKSNGGDDGGLCMTVTSTQKIIAAACHGGKTQQWQIGDAPAPPPSGGACNKACPSGSDSECAWLGGRNSCTKCDTTPGSRFMCVAP